MFHVFSISSPDYCSHLQALTHESSRIRYGPSKLAENLPSFFLALLVILHTMSPLTKDRGQNFELYFLATLYFVAMFLICTFSRSSVSNSRLAHRFCWFLSQSYTCLRKDCSSISTGIIASAPYTKLKGDSLVADQGVHLQAHNTSNNSFGHLPFAPSNLLRNSTNMTLLAASTCPLVCGCSTELVICLIPKSIQNLASSLSMNCRPLSIMIVCDTPY